VSWVQFSGHAIYVIFNTSRRGLVVQSVQTTGLIDKLGDSIEFRPALDRFN